jgi:signal transduction histidine kinase
LVFQESEKSRYQALGEMSALIAHYLSAPLHAIQYCYTEIKEQKLAEAADPYVQQMGLNISQSIELISALRARLKNDTSTVQKSNYLESHDLVIRLLETQFSSRLFQRLTITLDPNIADLTMAISRVDLMQIIDNLYRNSIKNLISTTNEKPTLEIQLKEKSDDFVSIIISDNGTGLSYEEFNLMTDDNPIAESSVGTARSLGLRLTRRLVENYDGTLTLSQSNTTEPNPVGTKFLLRLKLYSTDTISI